MKPGKISFVLLSMFLYLTSSIAWSQLTVSTFAGTANTAGFVDGPKNTARFDSPAGVAVDSAGNLYVIDAFNHCVRKISTSGNVSTFAGNGTSGFLDGQDTSARFNTPQGILYGYDHHLYVADAGNNSVRKITLNGLVSTFAGSGQSGHLDGVDTVAKFRAVMGLTMDEKGNIFAADPFNHCIRKIDTQGNVSTFAGDTILGYKNDIGRDARFTIPTSVVIDTAGNVYVAEPFNHTVRKITPNGVVTTFAGDTISDYVNGTRSNARFRQPYFLGISPENHIYVSDQQTWVMRHIGTDDMVSLLAGTPGSAGLVNGSGNSAQFFNLSGMAMHNQRALYVADYNNRVIRKIVTDQPQVTDEPLYYLCKGDRMIFAASGGTEYRWYADIEGKELLHTGSQFITPSLFESTTFYVTNVYKGLESEPLSRRILIQPMPLNFNVNSCVGNEPLYTVAFTNTTPNLNNFEFYWDFGDSYTSDSIHPVHQYSAEGTYTVQLIAMNNFTGCMDTVSKEIEVFEAPFLEFTHDTACVGAAVNFYGNGTISYGGLDYFWHFGNSDSAFTSEPDHIFSTPGDKNISLTVISDSNNCQTTVNKTVRVYENPVADFEFEKNCLFDTVEFNNLTQSVSQITDHYWSFGDGNNSVLSDPVNYYPDTGSYNVHLTVSNIEGCIDSIDKNINIIPAPYVDFGFSIACQYQSVMFSDSTIAPYGEPVYSWNFGDGNSDTISDPVHNYANSGDFNVILTVSVEGGCTKEKIREITVFPTAVADFEFNDVCDGDSVFFINTTQYEGTDELVYMWNFGDGSNSTDIDPVHLYNNTVSYKVQLFATAVSECKDSVLYEVNVYEIPDSEFDIVQNGLTVTLTPANINAASYSWEFGDGNNSEEKEPVHTYSEGGEYTISLTIISENGCSNTTEHSTAVTSVFSEKLFQNNINIYPNPVRVGSSLQLMLNSQYNDYISVQITDVSGRIVLENRSFRIESGLNDLEILNKNEAGLKPGIYNLKLENSAGYQYFEKIMLY